MTNLLQVLLPVYFIVYFGIAFIAKSLLIAQRIGKNPFVLPKSDSVYGLIGLYFKLTLVLIFVYVACYAFSPDIWGFFPLLPLFDALILQYTGIVFLFSALGWTIVAQSQMKTSWRIGIDTEMETELITTGLFGYSRNPIFLGMLLSLAGLFLSTPNALTLLFLVLGYVLIQVQIRLEEEFLARQHGHHYLQYKQKTRRFL